MSKEVLDYLRKAFGHELECEIVEGMPVVKCRESEDWDSLNQKLGGSYLLEFVAEYDHNNKGLLSRVLSWPLKILGTPEKTYEEQLFASLSRNLAKTAEEKKAVAVLHVLKESVKYDNASFTDRNNGKTCKVWGYALVPS